jgi:hypothetical protein
MTTPSNGNLPQTTTSDSDSDSELMIPLQITTHFKTRNSTSHLATKCRNCNKITNLSCAACRSEYYCSKTCQIARWVHHKRRCQRMLKKCEMCERVITRTARIYTTTHYTPNNNRTTKEVYCSKTCQRHEVNWVCGEPSVRFGMFWSSNTHCDMLRRIN